MTAIRKAMGTGGGHAALRLAVAGLLAATLAACNQTASESPLTSDYRVRHPITLSEGERTVELVLGSNRGGLTPVQRADVLAFAQMWRREATGGIVVDVPSGRSIDRAAADSMREVHQ